MATLATEESCHCREVGIVERWVLQGGGRCREVAVVER